MILRNSISFNMNILDIAQHWAKEEVFSSRFFIVAAILFIAASVGFYKLGHSELSRSYIYPTLVCGVLLLIIGVGLVYNDSRRYKSFPKEWQDNPTEFVQAEIERTEKTAESSYNTIYRTIPIIIIAAALLIIFIDKPIVRASCITFIAFLSVLLIVDSNAHSRIVTYNKALKTYKAEQ